MTVTANDRPSRWVGRAYIGPRFLFYDGMIAPTKAHAHPAIQIIWSAEGDVTLTDGHDATLSARCFIVPSEVPHAIARPCLGAFIIYLDPSVYRGTHVPASPNIADWRATSATLMALPKTPVGSWAEANDDASQVAQTLEATLPGRTLSPVVGRAMTLLKESVLGEDRPTITALAASLGISTSRLTHLFSAEVGWPFRRHLVWLRLQRAAAAFERGGNVTEAAHEAGFSDAAHLSRTFLDTFGIPPGIVSSAIQWVAPPRTESAWW